MIELQEKAVTFHLVELSMTEIGKMISSMALENKPGLIKLFIKEVI